MSDGARMECHKCGYKCTPQWLNDVAHCLKCQAVLRRRPVGAGAGAGVAATDEGRRECGEVSTYKHSPGSAMESSTGDCRRSPDGAHHWKFGKCTFCQRSEPPRGKPALAPGAVAPSSAGGAKTRAGAGPKLCVKCRKPYGGHGDTCGPCRTLGAKRGSSVQCRVCGSFSWGYGDTCEDCRDSEPPRGGDAPVHAYSGAAAVPVERGERVKMECPHCGYKCVPQWLNDEAHCLKCQAVLMMQPSIHGGEGNVLPAGSEARRKPGEVSTFKHAPASAMESASGDCGRSPDGLHHWKFGKCSYCQKPEGKQVKGAGAMVDPGGAAGCPAGGKCMFKFAKCSKCGRKEF